MGQKEKKELIILGVGILILALLWINGAIGRRRNVVSSARFMERTSLPSLNKNVSSQERGVEVIKDRQVKYTGRENRDPLDNSAIFRGVPGGAEAKEAPAPFPKEKFLVSAIIWGSKRPQAIINSKVVNIGEKLDGGKITWIDKKGVHLSVDGREVLLSIK